MISEEIMTGDVVAIYVEDRDYELVRLVSREGEFSIYADWYEDTFRHRHVMFGVDLLRMYLYSLVDLESVQRRMDAYTYKSERVIVVNGVPNG